MKGPRRDHVKADSGSEGGCWDWAFDSVQVWAGRLEGLWMAEPVVRAFGGVASVCFWSSPGKKLSIKQIDQPSILINTSLNDQYTIFKEIHQYPWSHGSNQQSVIKQ